MKPKHSLNHNIKSVPLVLTGNSWINLRDMRSALEASETAHLKNSTGSALR